MLNHPVVSLWLQEMNVADLIRSITRRVLSSVLFANSGGINIESWPVRLDMWLTFQPQYQSMTCGSGIKHSWKCSRHRHGSRITPSNRSKGFRVEIKVDNNKIWSKSNQTTWTDESGNPLRLSMAFVTLITVSICISSS